VYSVELTFRGILYRVILHNHDYVRFSLRDSALWPKSAVAISFRFILRSLVYFCQRMSITRAVGTRLKCAFGALKTTETIPVFCVSLFLIHIIWPQFICRN